MQSFTSETPVFDYAPTTDLNDTNFTSNLDHTLDSTAREILKHITPFDLTIAFGHREPDFYPGDYEHDEKGYTQPYWYFKAINGEVTGIGFRYGIPRAVGKNVSPERLSRFVRLVQRKIQIAHDV